MISEKRNELRRKLRKKRIEKGGGDREDES
jgi:hypothetical protein